MRTWILLLVVLLPTAAAFSISPATHTALAPQDEMTNITIVNTEQNQVNLTVEVDESIKAFVEAPIESFSLDPGAVAIYGYKSFIPENTLPGSYEGNIVITQTQQPRVRGVQALLALAHKVTVIVPQEGKHIAAYILTSPPVTGQPLAIAVLLQNVGTEHIESVNAAITIADKLYTTETVALENATEKRLQVTWPNATQGDYVITGTVTYDEKTIVETKDIRIGDVIIEAGVVSFSNFERGQPLAVTQPLENKWSEETSVTVTHTINTTPPLTFRSAPITLTPEEPVDAQLFWETRSLEVGTYKLTTLIQNGATETERSFVFVVAEDGVSLETPEEAFNGWLIISLILFVLVIGLIAWRWRR